MSEESRGIELNRLKPNWSIQRAPGRKKFEHLETLGSSAPSPNLGIQITKQELNGSQPDQALFPPGPMQFMFTVEVRTRDRQEQLLRRSGISVLRNETEA